MLTIYIIKYHNHRVGYTLSEGKYSVKPGGGCENMCKSTSPCGNRDKVNTRKGETGVNGMKGGKRELSLGTR